MSVNFELKLFMDLSLEEWKKIESDKNALLDVELLKNLRKDIYRRQHC